MAEQPDRATAPGAPGAARATDAILAVLAAGGPHGATAAQIARALGLGRAVEAVEDALEELVARADVDRRGIGVGAVYARGAGM